MSTNDNEQFRAGFEALAQQRGLMTARRPDGHYRRAATQTAWEFWLDGTLNASAKREASTEPSTGNMVVAKSAGNGPESAETRMVTGLDGAGEADGALTDEAKDAAIETMDHDQLGKLGRQFENTK